MAKYKRVLLKLSGEAISGENGILNFPFIKTIAEQVKKVTDEGVQVACIVGAGNIWRGRLGTDMDRVRADQMGMLATTINALALQDTFLHCGLKAKVMTSVEMKAFADYYTVRDAINALENGNVVIFGGGLGSPYFSTDTAAALRAAEIGADCILMAKNIDAIYSADPKTHPDAVRYGKVTFKQIIDENLRAVDMSSAVFCMENNINGYAFGLSNPENIYKAVIGETVGTEISNN